MRIANHQIVFQEVPDEITLAFLVAGCGLRCPDCHSKEAWTLKNTLELTMEKLKTLLTKYEGMISCILFMGGEWEETTLIEFLKESQKHGLKTCLYTGAEDVSQSVKEHLHYLKTGSFIKELGGLNSATTNQRFINVITEEILNYKFLTT